MEKSKKMNKKKKRLLIALFMLIISAVALTTATYAWFSANRVVTTTGIDVKVTAATGISISANALDFGKTISMDDVITFAKDTNFTSSLQLPEELNPVSTSGIKGTSNEFSFVRGELGDTEDLVAYTSSKVEKTFKTGDKSNYTGGDYISFDIYIKSSQDLNLKLADKTKILALKDGDTGNLESGLRIAFVPQGVSKDTTIANQQKAAVALNKASTDWKIWNPAPTAHHAATLVGYGSGDSEATKGYYGAADVTDTAVFLNSAGEVPSDADKAAENSHFVKYLYKDIDSSNVPDYLSLIDKDNANYVSGMDYAGTIFSVKAGINKVKVYIWLEGNDVDCVDAISISNGLTIDLGFEIADSTSTTTTTQPVAGE